MSEAIIPFRIEIPQAALDDLTDRLDRTRWPERETADNWEQGVPLADAQALCAYWRDTYDWRATEARLNAVGQYRTTIDGLGFHFLHIRSPEPTAMPMILTHGWPGSVVEFLKVIGPLTDPAAHGGDPADAFHLVVPSLPGFGFSDRPAEAGWTTMRTAKAWTVLMARLGYDRYVAQGGDWGSVVTSALGVLAPPQLAAIHLNMAMVQPTPEEIAQADPAEQLILADLKRLNDELMGYATLQTTRPQTIAYSLTDSPAGQASWIFEKFRDWTDCNGDPSTVFSYDELLDNIMMYWITGTGGSSARIYWESIRNFFDYRPTVPTGITMFPREIYRVSRRWAERHYGPLAFWSETERGGHFAAFEQPEIFVREVRQAFHPYR